MSYKHIFSALEAGSLFFIVVVFFVINNILITLFIILKNTQTVNTPKRVKKKYKHTQNEKELFNPSYPASITYHPDFQCVATLNIY